MKGSYIDEREFYQDFIKPLYKNLFNLDVNLKDYTQCYGFEVSSRALWTFKTNVLKIPAGRKTEIRVPDIVKVKNQEILAGLIRGYFDTDGCLSFVSKYGYPSYYPNINACSISEYLINDVAQILSMFGLRPYVWFDGNWWSVQMFGYANFYRFLDLIGWNSKKYVDKINSWVLRYPKLSNGADRLAWLGLRPVVCSQDKQKACYASSNLALRPFRFPKPFISGKARIVESKFKLRGELNG